MRWMVTYAIYAIDSNIEARRVYIVVPGQLDLKLQKID